MPLFRKARATSSKVSGPSVGSREAGTVVVFGWSAVVMTGPLSATSGTAGRIGGVDCCAYDRQFNARHAENDLREYRRNGPTGLTRALIDALSAGGIQGQSVLEIGGGVGAVHHELLRAGADAAVDVDASRAY